MKKLFGLLLVLGLLVTSCSSDGDSSPAATSTPAFSAENPAHVLRLDSYHPEFLWSQQVEAGVIAGLADSGYSEAEGNLVIDRFYMDTKRNTGEAYFASIAADAIEYIRTTQPDVVIVNDNNAIRLVVQQMLDDDVNFVFNGLNDEPETYGLTDHPHVTGVLERAHIAATLLWINSIFPNAAQITCLFDDSATSDAYLPAVEDALAKSIFADSPVYRTNSFDEWQEYVRSIDEASAALVVGTYHTLHDTDGNPVHEDTVIEWTTTNATVPVVPFWEFSIPFGTLGGMVISGDVQGYAAGEKAAMILDGTPPGDIPISTPQQGKMVLNRQAMEKLDVVMPVAILTNSEIYDPTADE